MSEARAATEAVAEATEAAAEATGRTAFLTGATGFIGSHLAERLAAAGWRLRCLARPDSDTAHLRSLGAELIAGDLDDGEALARGLDGASLAYHLAAIYQFGPSAHADTLRRVNVQGTRNVLDALRAAGTPRAVYVSTTAALGPVREGHGSEETRNDGPFRSDYERTKVEAHAMALAAQADGLPLLIAAPAFVYGPGDRGPGGVFIDDILKRRLPGLPTRFAHFSFVHVDDVADGLFAMSEHGVPHGTYVLGGEFASLGEVARLAAERGGVRLPFLRFPPFMVRLTGALLDPLSRLTGIRFPINEENAATTTGKLRWLHTYQRSERDLGYRPRSLADGLPETVADARSRLAMDPAG
ncbi:MAG: NAD-dependent epimerase/dehydratase family protein [Gemmatimonadota bacterium]